jgi:hypothetical protein
VALKMWHELPAATRKYISEVERKPGFAPLPPLAMPAAEAGAAAKQLQSAC